MDIGTTIKKIAAEIVVELHSDDVDLDAIEELADTIRAYAKEIDLRIEDGGEELLRVHVEAAATAAAELAEMIDSDVEVSAIPQDLHAHDDEHCEEFERDAEERGQDDEFDLEEYEVEFVDED